jgi:hypothetical protein
MYKRASGAGAARRRSSGRSDFLQKVAADEVREVRLRSEFFSTRVALSRSNDAHGWGSLAAAKPWKVKRRGWSRASGSPSSSEGSKPERLDRTRSGIHGGEAVAREARGLPLEIGNRLALRGAGYYCIPLCATYQHSIAADIAVLHEPDIMRPGL